MKIVDLRKLYLATALALGSLLLAMPSLFGPPATTTAQVVGPLPTFRPFFARSYGGKCLDFGGQAWWVVHNHNRGGGGYGVVTGYGGFPLIEGNTFLSNRHSIAADETARNGYRARFNLVLSPAPTYQGSRP